ncbi:hypothetical protein DNTS_014300 [Danionella cerebrum]|uniref:HMA domain-containing protein n=1 Tax=Danionella cerebrum TaxID=2873325 RepID=A0A553NH88_9TELE|nr:hypothetical protein DNTS_014300 [Danionella translucida]
MNKSSHFKNLAKLVSKQADPGEQLCLEDCRPRCGCGPEPGACAAALESTEHGPQEHKGNGRPEEGFDNLGYESEACGGWKLNLGQPLPAEESVVTIRVEGMTCQSCVRSIEEQMGSLRGVLGIQVFLSEKQAFLRFIASEVTPEDLVKNIEDIGFEASLLDCKPEFSPTEVTLGVEGMHCGSCVKNITEILSGMPGINSVLVSLEKESVDLSFDPSLLTLETVKAFLEEIPPGNFRVSIPGWTSVSIPPQCVAIGIEGMTCSSCVQAIESVVSQRAGVLSIEVHLQDKKGIVLFNSSVTSAEELRSAIEDMGFEARLNEGSGVFEDPSDGQMTTEKPKSRSSVVRLCKHNRRASEGTEPRKCFIHVTGMTCASCVSNIERNLLNHDGITSVLVSLMAGKVEVKYDPGILNPSRVVTGMTCASCVHNIESKLLRTKGILEASVALATNKAHVKFDSDLVGSRDIVRIIESLGFGVSLIKHEGLNNTLDHLEEIRQQVSWKHSFLFSLIFGIPVMGLMIYMMVMDSQHKEHGGSMPVEQNILPGLSIINLAFFLLCTPVQAWVYVDALLLYICLSHRA